jgi:hypothetical protein
MGVATAVSIDDYDIEDVDITRIADTKKSIASKRNAPVAALMSSSFAFLQLLKNFVSGVMSLPQTQQPFDKTEKKQM